MATEEATGSASAEVVGSTGSASAEVVEEELSTRSKLELQAVQIISENPWHLFQSGIMTLKNNKGERITNPYLFKTEIFLGGETNQESGTNRSQNLQGTCEQN